MKTNIFPWHRAIPLVFLIAFACGQFLFAQENSPTIYFEITNLKTDSDDFMAVQQEIVKPFVQERIKQGNLRAWALFRVLYPDSENKAYNYVAMSVFGDFDDIHMGDEKVFGIAGNLWNKSDFGAITKRYDESAENVGSQVFVLRADAVPGPPKDDKWPGIVRVNHMKVGEAHMDKYARMEEEIYMPLHQARIKDGAMDDWLLCQRIIPFGTEWDNTFITMDAFAEWGDMAKQPPPGFFKSIHPEKDPNSIWHEMAGLRELRRSEIWETVMVVNKPAEAVTYSVKKEGTGPSPMRGQEVTYRGKVMNHDGIVMMNTADLGLDFYHTIGSEPYDMFFDEGLMKMKKGGIMEMKVPADKLDAQTYNMLGGKPGVIKVELVDFGEPTMNGAALLEKKIKHHGLSVAKEKYNKLKADNPNGYVFREADMNELGYKLMAEDHLNEALYIFTLNTKLNPDSWNACDSLGDAYAAKGDKNKARECYERAVKINPECKYAKDKLAGM